MSAFGGPSAFGAGYINPSASLLGMYGNPSSKKKSVATPAIASGNPWKHSPYQVPFYKAANPFGSVAKNFANPYTANAIKPAVQPPPIKHDTPAWSGPAWPLPTKNAPADNAH